MLVNYWFCNPSNSLHWNKMIPNTSLNASSKDNELIHYCSPLVFSSFSFRTFPNMILILPVSWRWVASAKPSSVAPLMAIVTVRLCGATAQVELPFRFDSAEEEETPVSPKTKTKFRVPSQIWHGHHRRAVEGSQIPNSKQINKQWNKAPQCWVHRERAPL